MRKSAAIILAGVLLAASIWAGGARDVPRSARQRTTLRVLWWGGQVRHEATLKVLDMYASMHPHIRIEPTYLQWANYWDKLAVFVAAGTMPDVVQMVIERFPQFQERRLLTDLRAVAGLDLSTIDRTVVDAGVMGGEMLGVVLGVNALTIAYNPAVFASAGVPEPWPGWTWDDLKAMGARIREAGYTVVENLDENNAFEYWLRSRGYALFSPDGRSPGWSGVEAPLGYFQMLDEFNTLGLLPPPAYVMERPSSENTMYARGRSAMRLMWSNQVAAVYRTLRKPSRLAVLPGPGSERGMFLRPSMYFSIAADSRVKQEAGSFINFFLNDIAANYVLGAERGIPVVREVREALKARADEQDRLIFEYLDHVAEHSSSPRKVYPAAEGEYRRLYEEISKRVLFRQFTPAEAARELTRRLSEILGR